MSDKSFSSSVFYADTLPKRTPSYQLTFRFKHAEIGVSKDLYKLLGGDDCHRVAFIQYRDAWYITRSNYVGALNLVTSSKSKFGVVSVLITSQSFTRYLRQQWGYSPSDHVYVPLAVFPTAAADLGLDPKEHPYPLYRLALDQRSVKA